jgi:hypothetical protein
VTAPDLLYLDFVGQEFTLAPRDTLTFGKDADLVVDEYDEYLHRQVGIVEHANGAWWLTNLGDRIVISVEDANGPSFKQLAPGTRDVLVYPEFFVRFRTRTARYELEGSLADPNANAPRTAVRPRFGDDEETATWSWGEVELNEHERRLLVALCANRLEAGRNAPVTLPSNEDARTRLGIRATTYNRRLDHLCARFADAGVEGLVGSDGKLARDRRHALVEHVLRYGIVTRDDLVLLD